MSLVEIVHYDKSKEEQNIEKIDYVEEIILFSTSIKMLYEYSKKNFIRQRCRR